jgi:hypothetical protein
LQQPASRRQVSGRRAQADQASALVWRGPRAPFSVKPSSRTRCSLKRCCAEPGPGKQHDTIRRHGPRLCSASSR